MPFLVNMARLFELFVAEWLKAHLPEHLTVKMQERVDISPDGSLHFDIDLVLYDAVSGQAICVLDTKYKLNDQPNPGDIAQIVAYCEAKGCREAVLIYPMALVERFDVCIGGIRIRSISFCLTGDIETAENDFLDDLMSFFSVSRSPRCGVRYA
jgi:5-methylcytosine-specific restriction enzyme subunit McrC